MYLDYLFVIFIQFCPPHFWSLSFVPCLKWPQNNTFIDLFKIYPQKNKKQKTKNKSMSVTTGQIRNMKIF